MDTTPLPPTGPTDAAAFARALAAAAPLSTVGISTLSGVSPRNARLMALARGVGALPEGDQVPALQAALAESAMLWADQHAHVVATLILDLLHGRLAPAASARGGVAGLLLAAARAVAPALVSAGAVNDSLAHDVLKCYVNVLVRDPGFDFGPDAGALLREAGLHDPVAGLRPRGADRPEEEHLRDAIGNAMLRQIGPDTLAGLVARIAALPDHLRGRLLAMLVNVLWNVVRDPNNSRLVDRIGAMVADLPPRIRVTPLEAYYNQINYLPFPMASRYHPMVLRLVEAMPERADDPRHARLRHDLLVGLRDQKAILESGRLGRDDTISRSRRG